MSNPGERRKKHTSIRIRLLRGMVLLGMILVIGSAVAINARNNIEVVDVYERIAFSYTRAAADIIDGERVKQYLETGVEDDYYREIARYLKSMQKESDIVYFYVFVPCEDDMLFIWGKNDSDGTGGKALGHRERYMPGEDEASKRVFRQNPPEKIIGSIDEEYGNLWTACSPIFDAQGNPVAVAAVNLSIDSMDHMTMLFVRDVAISIIVLMVLSLALQYYYVDQRIIKTIGLLTEATSELVGKIERGEEFSVDIHTNDEIEQLSESIHGMEKGLRQYIRENAEMTSEQERINTELNTAARIQTGSLPSSLPAFPGREAFEIAAMMEPAKEIGGDFYDFYLLDEDHLAMVVADVSGKGIPAALFMMVSKTVIRTVAASTRSPRDILLDANAVLSKDNKEDMFVTVWLGVLEISTGRLTYADAGHERLAVYHEQQWRVMEKTHRGIALCMVEPDEMEDLPEMYQIVNQELQLHPGDVIFQYTDGVTEATDSTEELFGGERLLEALECAQDVTPEPLLRHVHSRIDAFVREAPQFDDITMLGLRYYG